jgi:hypothetical protein
MFPMQTQKKRLMELVPKVPELCLSASGAVFCAHSRKGHPNAQQAAATSPLGLFAAVFMIKMIHFQFYSPVLHFFKVYIGSIFWEG